MIIIIIIIVTMSRRKIKMVRKIKCKTLIKREIKGLDRENIVHPGMNQIVIVKINHQRTHMLTLAHHQNNQRKKCPKMSMSHQSSLPSLQQKV